MKKIVEDEYEEDFDKEDKVVKEEAKNKIDIYDHEYDDY